jgi:hypothetical protein
MTDVKNLDFVLVIANLIVDEKWAVKQFTDQRASFEPGHPCGESGSVIQRGHQCLAKAGGSLRVIFGNVDDDFGEVV